MFQRRHHAAVAAVIAEMSEDARDEACYAFARYFEKSSASFRASKFIVDCRVDDEVASATLKAA